jgi:predicted O-methyltransferase YrrM
MESAMPKRISDPQYITISDPSKDAIDILSKILSKNLTPVIAEIGIGVGATTYALLKLLNNNGALHIFDFEETLSEFSLEAESEHFTNIIKHPNGRRTFESYNWNLAKMLREARSNGNSALFDMVYLDGAHAFHHDAPAALVIKELLKPDGYIVFDDYSWTFATSPTCRPDVNKSTASNYSEEQIKEPHIALICELFFDYDSQFRRVDLGYDQNELRRAYQKL